MQMINLWLHVGTTNYSWGNNLVGVGSYSSQLFGPLASKSAVPEPPDGGAWPNLFCLLILPAL